jgi:hypothetical protein
MMENGTRPDEVLKCLQAAVRGHELRQWRPLLQTAEQCRNSARAVYTALRLFHTVPPDEYLRASGVTLGEWTDYHMSSWVVARQALLERVEQLVMQTCRRFLKQRTSAWQRTQNSILTKVRDMVKASRGMRVRHAHGFGYFDAMEDKKLWEIYVLFPEVDLVASGLAQEVQFRDRWGKRLVNYTAATLAVIDATFDRLTTELSWQPLPSQTSA